MLKLIGIIITFVSYMGIIENATDYPNAQKVVVPAFMVVVGMTMALSDTVECLPDTIAVIKEENQ